MSQDDGGLLPQTGATALIAIGGAAVTANHLWIIASGAGLIIGGLLLLRLGRSRRADRATLS